MDKWIAETAESTPRWVAVLSNGDEYYQDDGRPETVGSAWERLQIYCRENNVQIRDIYLRFRSHIERSELYRDADGYWFRFGARGSPRIKKTTQSYVIGIIRGNDMLVENWRIPELIKLESENRKVDTNDDTIIWSIPKIGSNSSGDDG